MRRLLYVFAAVTIAGALLAGCNLPFLAKDDTASVQTAAALTVQAQIASVAPATFTAVPFPTIPPANTPGPTNTAVNTQPPAATATSKCDSAAFVADVSIPDNTAINAGASFTKTWRLKNTGACSWTPSYAVVFVSGTSMAGPVVQALAGNVNPGQTVDLSVELTAPATNGTYTGNWALRNAAGVIFSHFYVQIVVSSGSSGEAFAVTNVGFAVTGSCGAFHTTVGITTNGAGTVSYHKVFSDGGTDSTPGTLTFTAAGTKSFSFDSSNSATSWIDIYIDSPNHQQFGRANFTCP
jgi:hypothetical protein